MRPICWLHISDIHVRVREEWSQDVVLRAMCDHITRRGAEGMKPDFVLASGDLAFSGKAAEYALVARFFDAISTVTGVPKARIYCVPGNHDIDRDRQTLSFIGARSFLRDQNRIDSFLGGGDNLETLIKRQECYRTFQASYFCDQDRSPTPDGLGYVCHLAIDCVRLAIIGLDSAWLAEGGIEDHGNLVIGERQVIDAITMAQECDEPPNITLSMAHHPTHLLQEFDRRPIQNRIERASHFFHCGHLHEPEARLGGLSASGCLTLAAGASFETRQSHNSFSYVVLDLMQGKRTVTTARYSPGSGSFLSLAPEDFSFDVAPTAACGMRELAQAISGYNTTLAPWAHYLSALLLDQKAELPIPSQSGHTFGSFALLETLPQSSLKVLTTDFLAFRNAIRVLYKRVPLTDILVAHGEAVVRYGAALKQLCVVEPSLNARLAQHESEAKALASAQGDIPRSHAGALLAELAAAHEWIQLAEHARRHLDAFDDAVALQAKRMLALSLANSTAADDHKAAVDLYESLVEAGLADVTDIGNLSRLLLELKAFGKAKQVLLAGIEKVPTIRIAHLSQVGQEIVEATADRAFRKQLQEAIAKRGERG